MNPLDRRRTARPAPWALGWGVAAVVLVTAAALSPDRGVMVLTVAETGAALVAGVVLHRREMLRTRVGGAVVALLALLACSSVVLWAVGPGAPLALALIVVGQVIGLVGTVPTYIAYAQSAAGPRRGRVLGAEVAIVAVGTGVAVTQSWARVHRIGGDLSTSLTVGIDLLGLAVIGWLLLTRRRLLPTVAMAVAAGGLLMLQNYLAAVAAIPLGSAGELGLPLGVLGALVLGAAITHSSLETLVAGRYRPLLRSGAARLRVVVPFACIPALAWIVGLVDPTSRLPAMVIVAAAVGISLLGLVTAFGLVDESEKAAEGDPLSGHLGRLGAMRLLEELHAERAPTAVVLVDIDDFTDVNQRHGQQVGDAALVAVLDRMATRLPSGSVVARLSGDELLALLPLDADLEADRESAGELVSGLFVEPFAAGEAAVALRASIGVAGLLVRPDGLAREALADADVAQRLAKSRGGARCVTYDQSVRAEVMEPVHLLRDLRALLGPATGAGGASAEDVGHLVVHYQPIIDVATGAPAYVEALVRWIHPQRGMIFPDTFLPLAELGGVAAALDRAVMTQALRQLADWDAASLGVQRISVNLGGASMREGGLWTFAVTACRDAGVGLDRLVLEITEHDALDVDVDGGVVEDLLALRDAGAQVALDDFGAGHASVGYLRRWPASVVKLDRSLLPSVSPPAHHDAMLDAHLLLASVADLVHALGLRLLVEGVEDAQDEALVASIGAQNAQGYHFSRPVPAGDLAHWWRAQPAGADPHAVAAARTARDRVT